MSFKVTSHSNHSLIPGFWIKRYLLPEGTEISQLQSTGERAGKCSDPEILGKKRERKAPWEWEMSRSRMFLALPKWFLLSWSRGAPAVLGHNSKGHRREELPNEFGTWGRLWDKARATPVGSPPWICSWNSTRWSRQKGITGTQHLLHPRRS